MESDVDIDTALSHLEAIDATTKKSAATQIVDLAEELFTFGSTDAGECFAIPRSGPRVVALLRGSKTSLRGQLAKAYFQRFRRAASQQALADAMLAIEGLANEAPTSDLHLRVALAQGDHWLDLGDQSGTAVRINAKGWTVEQQSPMFFKRTALNSALPMPERGGSLDELWQLLNVSDSDRPLVAAWLVSSLHPGIAHPVLSLFGEQGTGKTTAERMLVQILDPSPVPTRKPPRDAESWVTAAAGSWVVGLDNLSVIPEWLSDSICRAVTGDGDVRRKLYTDGDFAVFAFRRCIILNGIDLGALRGDLADRMLPIHLDPIPDQRRTGDAHIWPEWERAHPRILGAVLDLAAGVAGMLPSVDLASSPRMADFAKILAAVDATLGTSGLSSYLSKQGDLATDSLTGDPLIAAIAQRLPGGFCGTSGDLLNMVRPDRPPKGWPANARAVTQRLNRQAPVMRKAGWQIHNDGGANHDKVVRWTICPPSHPEIVGNSSPQDPRDPQKSFSAGLAGVAGQDYGQSQCDQCAKCAGEGCGYCGSER